MRPELQQAIANAVKSTKRALLPVAVGVGAWVLAVQLELISSDVASAGSMIVAAILFFLAMPLSVVCRLDLLFLHFPTLEPSLAVLIAFLVVGANFFLWFVGRALWKARKSTTPPREKPSIPKLSGVAGQVKAATSEKGSSPSPREAEAVAGRDGSSRPRPARKFGAVKHASEEDSSADDSEEKKDDDWTFH